MYEPKLKELFILFDFDGSGNIDYTEMFLAMQSTVLGFCKLLGLPLPSSDMVKALSDRAVVILDSDENDM